MNAQDKQHLEALRRKYATLRTNVRLIANLPDSDEPYNGTAVAMARAAASQLRKAGYRVTSQSMGTQITEVGAIRMTLVDIRPGQGQEDTSMEDETMTLEKGKRYDFRTDTHEPRGFTLVGWTDGDGSGALGYYVDYYFDKEGYYLGPDINGIEPKFKKVKPR